MLNIAIDGTSGSGKSSVATLLAKRLGVKHLNTGALYRAIAVYYIDNKLDYKDENVVNQHLFDINIDVKFDNNEQVTLLNGKALTGCLHLPITSDVSSTISQFGEVRESIKNLQVTLAQKYDIILEGRDIGTKILPDAKYKFFITASSSVRAKRRYKQLVEEGVENVNLVDIQKDIEERDYRDSHRKLSPLLVADGAVVVDTSNLTLEEVVEKVASIIEEDSCII